MKDSRFVHESWSSNRVPVDRTNTESKKKLIVTDPINWPQIRAAGELKINFLYSSMPCQAPCDHKTWSILKYPYTIYASVLWAFQY